MKIVVIGGSGLIGSKLVDSLRRRAMRSWRHRRLGRQHHHRRGSGRGACRRTGRRRRGELAVVRGQAVLEFFETSGRNLLAAEKRRRRRASRCAVGRRHRAPAGERLFPRQGGAGEADQGLRYSLHDPAFDAVLRVRRRHRPSGTDGDAIRLSPALLQPIASDDVAAALADVAVAPPVNGTVEVAGPEEIPLDNRPAVPGREGRQPPVIADVHARYFGTELNDQSLTPGEHPRLGPIRFEDWLSHWPFGSSGQPIAARPR